jgi:hypothetical protein
MAAKVTEGADKVLSKRDKSESMNDTAFVYEKLNGIYTVERFGSKKAAQNAAYDFLRKLIRERPLKMRRVRAFFEGRARLIRGEEKDAVRAAEIEESKREHRELCRRLSALDAKLAELGASFHEPHG